ncbi:MAG: circularly permuted type 2 ATP-grasp protein [Microbacterium sp.]|uniref:circularly permuted type 2 ATP-grasp protein n=1 Tax=Microbacterium sp. TaxID=51671 RepID=UPI0039E3D7BC
MSLLRDYADAVTRPPLVVTDDVAPRYDEVVAPDGAFRTAWKGVASVALGLTPDELRRLDGEITRFLADDGVSYVRSDTGPQAWQLDPVPLIIDAATWSRLEVGLAQRAELLNALLADLYGPQRLLSTGVVPAAAVLGHAGFARPLARPTRPDATPLVLTGTDLGRDAAGEWHVLADRVQAPSGLGYAMENRRVISQVLPELYHESGLHRVEPYYAALRAALIESAADVAEPRVVVLSPGTYSETAFDQAFLANVLGFPLVQGEDLVVRDGWVWMKPAGWPTAAPSERVDVILRRVDADWCDPLELRAHSQLGVAGLAEAVRRGRVRLVNGLGAGVLENPALMPFLPAVCETLLGEQLRLPSVPTWWCGDPCARELVLDRLAAGDPTLAVRLIDAPRRALAGLDPHQVRERVLAAPHRFAGQERLPLSQAPVWDTGGGRVDARGLVFRAFTLRYGSAYRPLVGGMATVRERPDDAPIAKDVWVLKSAVADPDQGLPEVLPLPVARSAPALGPRALEDMFWAGRYAERAEDLLRLLLTTQAQLDERGVGAESSQSVRALRAALKSLAGAPAADLEAELRSLLLDTGRPGSAAHSLARLRDALEGVRDQLSGDTWRVFSSIDRATKALRASSRSHRTAESGGRMLAATLSLYGITASMIRDAGWHMIETGRHLERGLQVCRLLAATMGKRGGQHADRDMLETLLTAAESIVTHRRRYRGSVRASDALELLLLDGGNPRSLAFALGEVRAHLAEMPASTGSTRPERLVEHLESELRDVDVAQLAQAHGERRRRLARFLSDTVTRLSQLADAIDELHFEAGPPPQAMSSLSLIEERARA